MLKAKECRYHRLTPPILLCARAEAIMVFLYSAGNKVCKPSWCKKVVTTDSAIIEDNMTKDRGI